LTSGTNGRRICSDFTAGLKTRPSIEKREPAALDNSQHSSFNTRMSKKHRESIQKQFTKTAEAFSIFAMRDSPEVLKEKVDFAKPQPTDIALDIACGPGAFVLALAPRVHSARGIDLTPEMLHRALGFRAEKQIANADFVRGEAEQLPFAPGSFNLVSCQCAFHHMPKPKVILNEMVRVMKPEGRLVIIDPVAPESDSKFEIYNHIELLRDPSHTLTLRLTEFLRLFDEAGLEIQRQSLRRRQRSFDNWILRGGHAPGSKKYIETRKLMESSMNGDKSGFSAQPDGTDIKIIHNEAMFLLKSKSANAEEE
jgi:ubiquinone/menaquinone biosynthesis C-methylase UbiE